MIYVIDDGGEYSDRHIYYAYVRTPAEGQLLERAVALRAKYGGYGKDGAAVVFRAADVEWLADIKPCALRDAIEGLVPEYQHEGEPTEEDYRALMADLQKETS